MIRKAIDYTGSQRIDVIFVFGSRIFLAQLWSKKRFLKFVGPWFFVRLSIGD